MSRQSKESSLQTLVKRFNEKVVEPMCEEYPHSHKFWIATMKPIGFTDNVLTIHHSDPRWLDKHYGARIKELLNEGAKIEVKIQFTNQI